MTARTLYDKLWDSHLVHEAPDGTALIYIDRHLVHEVTSPQAYEGLKLANRKPWRVDSIVATADHNTPTKNWDQGIKDPVSRLQVETLDANIKEYGAKIYFPFLDKQQGIVHIIGPEQGATLPGMTLVCGDSHTSTHGALACLAFGIGTSEVEHVLATQCMVMKKSKTMSVVVDGKLGRGITAKDIILAVIGKIGSAGGSGYTIEYSGSAIRALSMEGRMTVCNMSIEAGARAGMVAVDDATIEYVKGTPARAQGEDVGEGGGLLAHARLRSGREVRQGGYARCGGDQAASDLGHQSADGDDGGWQGARSGAGAGSGQARVDRARAQVHGSQAEHADHGDQARQGIHRCLHQFADRGSARGGEGGRRASTSAPSIKLAMVVPGSGLVKQQAESGRARQDIHGRRDSSGASRAARCASA